MISAIISIIIGSAVWSLILAPILQLAFKIVVGERNAFGDAYRICFIANITQGIVTILIPVMLGMEASDSLMIDIAGPVLQVLVFTYLIAKELGDLTKSFIIALLLTGLTWLIFFFLLAAIIAGALVAA